MSLLLPLFSTFIPFSLLSSLFPSSLLTSSCPYFLPLFSFQVFLSSICHFPRVVLRFPFEDDHLLNTQPTHSMSDHPPTPMIAFRVCTMTGVSLVHEFTPLWPDCDELGKWKRTETWLVRIHIKILLDPRRNSHSLAKPEDHTT